MADGALGAAGGTRDPGLPGSKVTRQILGPCMTRSVAPRLSLRHIKWKSDRRENASVRSVLATGQSSSRRHAGIALAGPAVFTVT
jgi:hypothetical protein